MVMTATRRRQLSRAKEKSLAKRDAELDKVNLQKRIHTEARLQGLIARYENHTCFECEMFPSTNDGPLCVGCKADVKRFGECNRCGRLLFDGACPDEGC